MNPVCAAPPFESSGFFPAIEGARETICSFREREFPCIEKTLPEGNVFQYTPEITSLLDKVLGCPPARDALRKALKDGPITILTPHDYEAPAGGIWEVNARAIGILRTENPNRKLGHLMFELTNALQYEGQMQLLKDTLNGEVDRKNYAMRWEQIEFQTGKDFTAAIEQCIAKCQWPKATHMDIPRLYEKVSDWPTFWHLIKDSKHAEQFRTDWEDHGFKSVYCEKHSLAWDCW